MERRPGTVVQARAADRFPTSYASSYAQHSSRGPAVPYTTTSELGRARVAAAETQVAAALSAGTPRSNHAGTVRRGGGGGEPGALPGRAQRDSAPSTTGPTVRMAHPAEGRAARGNMGSTSPPVTSAPGGAGSTPAPTIDTAVAPSSGPPSTTSSLSSRFFAMFRRRPSPGGVRASGAALVATARKLDDAEAQRFLAGGSGSGGGGGGAAGALSGSSIPQPRRTLSVQRHVAGASMGPVRVPAPAVGGHPAPTGPTPAAQRGARIAHGQQEAVNNLHSGRPAGGRPRERSLSGAGAGGGGDNRARVSALLGGAVSGSPAGAGALRLRLVGAPTLSSSPPKPAPHTVPSQYAHAPATVADAALYNWPELPSSSWLQPVLPPTQHAHFAAHVGVVAHAVEAYNAPAPVAAPAANDRATRPAAGAPHTAAPAFGDRPLRTAVPLPPGPPRLPMAATATINLVPEPASPPKRPPASAGVVHRSEADSDDDTDDGSSAGCASGGAAAMPLHGPAAAPSPPSRLFSSPSSSQHAASPRGLVGLSNLGNTCYMNATLQCLSNIPPLRSYFASGDFGRDLDTARSPTKGEVARSFGALMREMWDPRHGQGAVVTPADFKRVVGRLGGHRFAGYAQHDSHELLRLLVEALGDDTNRVRGAPPYKELDAPPGKSDAAISEEWWAYYGARQQSVSWQLFAGQLKTSVVCSRCGTTHRAFDPFQDLQLPLSRNASGLSMLTGGSGGGDVVPLERCLAELGAEEQLTGDNAYYCGACKAHTACAKSMALFRLPPVLVLQLKRFGGSAWRRSKVTEPVCFPVRGLDVRPWCAKEGPGGSTLYDLIAVSCHSGDLGGGHYYAYARNCDTGAWWTFNDSSVRPCDIEREAAGSRSAYVLVYIRRDGGERGGRAVAEGGGARPAL